MTPSLPSAVPTDLSADAIRGRAILAAYGEARAMTKAFKGIRGGKGRKFYARQAMRNHGL